MKDLVDQAIAQLSDDGRRLKHSSDAWPLKFKKWHRKKAAQSMRIPLRSAHRFSVTEDMITFCEDLAFRLRETELEALIENAAPPFECVVFENMPQAGAGILVQRKRWNAMDVWFPMQDTLEEAYDDPEAFGRLIVKNSQRMKAEKALATLGVPNSADHPIYSITLFWMDHDHYLSVEPFGFYFCPTGFLWREPKNRDIADTTEQFLRSAYAFGMHTHDAELIPLEGHTWSPAYRKVCMSTTNFLPLFIGESVRDKHIRIRGSHFFPRSRLIRDYNDMRVVSGIEGCLTNWSREKVALQILSLLSTLNFDWIVEGAEPSKTGQRVKIEPDAPFNSHSEIQINLPKEKGVELALKKFHRASPLGVRRHWVRAHNRVIRKNGVPVKVIRVSEHQRGDAKLGTVTHDYVLERDHKVKA
jgi:hypothetical protein